MHNIVTYVNPDFIKVLIDGLPHIFIEKKTYLGLRSYADAKEVISSTQYRYKIEFVMQGNSMTTSYVDREIWAEILKQLNNSI